jgi:drug/metabolite transporter (DMT)-like permease
VFAIVVAWLFLGELPTSLQLGGGALIIAGVALVRIDELRRPATTLAGSAA